MSSQDEQNTEKQERKRTPLPGAWRPVDPRVWTRRGPPPKGIRKLTPIVQRIGSVVLHPVALPLLALAGIVGFLATFAIAFYVGGPSFFGPVLLTIWGGIITVGVVVIEKSGYGRNFEAWDFPLRKILYGIPGLALGVGLFYLFLAVLHH